MATFNGTYQYLWLKLYMKALPDTIKDNKLFMNVTCRTEKNGFLHIKFWLFAKILALLGFRFEAEMKQLAGNRYSEEQPIGRIFYLG